MKKTIILSAAVVAFTFSSCNSTNPAEQTTESTEQNFKLDTTMLKSGESFYQCSMDPDVVSDKVGACPKCGMDLEKKEKK